MARKTGESWWRAERKQWYVQHNGKQVPLGPNEAEAHKRWHTLMALSGVSSARDDNPFKVIGDEFLDYTHRHRKPKTYHVYRMHLEAFGNLHGNVVVKDLKPHHVDAVLKLHPDWSKSTIRGFMVCILSCLNWSVKQGFTTFNPLSKRLAIPKIVSRGKESIISPEDYEKMMAHALPSLRDFLVACRNTGTRPILVATVTAKHFHEDAECWVFDEHKTDDSGELLVVHLNDTMMDLTRKLVALHPEGPLFRNSRGNQWTDTAWGKAMSGLRKTLKKHDVKITGRGIMYGFRHSYATDLLTEGVPDAHAAALLGHKSTVMIHKHYSHIASKTKTLKAHLRHIGKVNGEVTVTDADAEVRTASVLDAGSTGASPAGGSAA